MNIQFIYVNITYTANKNKIINGVNDIITRNKNIPHSFIIALTNFLYGLEISVTGIFSISNIFFTTPERY